VAGAGGRCREQGEQGKQGQPDGGKHGPRLGESGREVKLA
jgi:hypothetical protein